MAYQKMTDLFIATATDYNPKSEEAYTFFKIIQNKLHYAISGHTVAELIYKYNVIIAKNYLNEEEININCEEWANAKLSKSAGK